MVSKVLLVSDQPVLLGGFQEVLAGRGFETAVYNYAGQPVEVTQAAVHSAAPAPPPDLILMDLTGGFTFSELTEVNGRFPGCPVVLWAECMPLDTVFRALEFGVRGIVERSATAEQLADSLHRVAGGEMQIGFAATRENSPPKRRASLTPREREIVILLRQGLRNKQIAMEMGITEGTVKIYLFRLFHKLDVRNRFELARSGVVDQMPIPQARVPSPVSADGGQSQPPGGLRRVASSAF